MPTSSHSSSNPPTPPYIFRHHNHPIHALHFFRRNEFFASGDSSGLIVIWRLVTRRPVAAFQAHDAGIMGIKDWGGGRLITHGRDHKLRVWEIKPADLEGVARGPAQIMNSSDQDGKGDRNQGQTPWLLHSMSVNALNFCAFSVCPMPGHISTSEKPVMTTGEDDSESKPDSDAPTTTDEEPAIKSYFVAIIPPKPALSPLLLASPNGLDSGGIDIFHLPSEHRISQIRSTKESSKAGMVMALNLSFDVSNNRLLLVSGYEDGSVAVHQMSGKIDQFATWTWKSILTSRPHSQPVLSLDVTADCGVFVTSSADAVIARFVMPEMQDAEFFVGTSGPERAVNTKHAGQQDLKIRSDGRVFATAGWDGNVRFYSMKTCKELAVLQWHREGCYAVAFAEVLEEDGSGVEGNGGEERSLVQRSAMDKMKWERDRKIHNTHWIVAGSKDGKISLWDIY